MPLSIPERYLRILIPLMESFGNETTDFNRIHFRTSLQPYMYPIVFLYLFILVAGSVGNILLMRELVRRRRQLPSCLHFLVDLFLGNCLNDIFIKCFLVLPVSFLILTSVHWTLGPFLCASFPLLQDSCFHATSLTFLSAMCVRYKNLKSASTSACSGSGTGGSGADSAAEINYVQYEFNPTYCLVTCWLISVIGVIPHTIFIEYLDLALFFGPAFAGTGLCAVNLQGNVEEYIRVLFVLFYLVPIVISISYHCRAVDVIKSWTKAVEDMERRAIVSRSQSTGHGNSARNSRTSNSNDREFGRVVRSDSDWDWDLTTSLYLEQKVQTLLFIMFAVQSASLLPLNILRFSKHIVIETKEFSFTFDVTFIAFVAIQFSSVVAMPVLVLLLAPKADQEIEQLGIRPSASRSNVRSEYMEMQSSVSNARRQTT